MTDQEILQNLLNEVRHMVVAVTLADCKPWAVPVHIQRHEGKEFEWFSVATTVHSEAIRTNPQVAFTIFSPETGNGFYAKARAEEVPETRREDGSARYRAVVTEAWINENHIKRPIELS